MSNTRNNRVSNVDWQIDKKSNSERAKHMFDTSLYCDCEFLVGGEEGKELVKAHRVFLAMGSPVFEAMFFGGMAQANAQHQSTSQGDIDAIDVLDLQPSAFKDLVEYIYTEDIELMTFDQAYELCYAAKKYMVPNLVEKCSQFMWKDLIPENVCRALEFANLYEDMLLKERSLNLIRCQSRESFSNAEFDDITESTLLILVKDDDLVISETDLFDAIKRWAIKECGRKEMDANGTNLRQVLTNIVGHIRFLTMTSEEFAAGPALSGVLTQEESFAILMNLSSRDKWPMPTQLSNSRLQRGGGSFIQHRPNISSSSNPSPVPRNLDGNGMASASSGRIYVLRRQDERTETMVQNTGILDCAVTLTVDRNVCIQGVIVASQAHGRNEDGTCDFTSTGGYTELLYCHLLDRDGTRLTYSHFSGRSPRRSTLDVSFNRPVYVQRNREYRICVVLNRCGYYPLVNSETTVVSGGVQFRFGASPGSGFNHSSQYVSDPFSMDRPQSCEGIRDGLIRGIIFSF